MTGVPICSLCDITAECEDPLENADGHAAAGVAAAPFQVQLALERLVDRRSGAAA